MPELIREGEIEVAQDLDHERRAYTARKVATVLFVLLIVAGLLGLLGRSGPLSDASARDGSQLEVGYERFLRIDSPTELEVSLGAGSGPTELALASDYLEGFNVSGFTVEPESSSVEGDRVVYVFDQSAPSQITVVLEPEEIGFQSATLYGPGGAELSFDQWVWP
ncbi:MAG TPA: hypothetical protein VFY69_07040 [Solirubrobacterales bacterium]|nr:hypothetical protein [Solirubrobacterales bacterium]